MAIDWSKYYDHLGFSYVRATLEAAGVPPWVVNPLMTMYQAPRHIKVDAPAPALHPTRMPGGR